MTPAALSLFTRDLLEDLAMKAGTSPRRRSHFNLHGSPADPVQRFFVCAERDSYFRPHRHLVRSELAVVLRGRFDVLLFDDQGRITGRHPVGEGADAFAWEVPQATWHTLLATGNGSTFLEVKQGPYDPATAVEFAPWAPAEGDPAAPPYMEGLRGG